MVQTPGAGVSQELQKTTTPNKFSAIPVRELVYPFDDRYVPQPQDTAFASSQGPHVQALHSRFRASGRGEDKPLARG